MSAVESKHEQIAEALKDLLGGIVSDEGETFWYTPDAVERVTVWQDRDLDSSLGHVILIRPGEENHFEEASQEVHAEMEVFLLVGRKHGPATENPYAHDFPSRWTVIDRGIKDVLTKLWGWAAAGVTLGSLIENIAGDSIRINRVEELAGWALAEVRFVIWYSYPKATP